MNREEFNDIELDAIKEVINIGSGNAATAISELINKKVNMTVPKISILGFDEIFGKLDADKIVLSIGTRILGEIHGSILFVLEKNKFNEFVKLYEPREEKDKSNLNLEILQDVGGIVAQYFIKSISKFTGLDVVSSCQEVVEDALGAILSTTFIELSQFEEKVVDLEIRFLVSENYENVIGHLYYIPTTDSLDKILKALKVR